MGYFEYVMVLVSIIIGLALTHILTALGSAVHRLRGHGPPIKLDATYLIWIVAVLIYLVSFWWTEFKFQDSSTEWTFGLYLFLVTFAISQFLLAVILVPPGMKGVGDSYAYFMAGRRWFFGAFFVVTILDLVDTFLKGLDWGAHPIVLIQTAFVFTFCVVGSVSENKVVQLGIAVILLSIGLFYMFSRLGVLGS
jgi:hypothetical protein